MGASPPFIATSKLFDVLTNSCEDLAKGWLATVVERTRSFVRTLEQATNLGVFQTEGWIFSNYLVVCGWKAPILMGDVFRRTDEQRACMIQ